MVDGAMVLPLSRPCLFRLSASITQQSGTVAWFDYVHSSSSANCYHLYPLTWLLHRTTTSSGSFDTALVRSWLKHLCTTEQTGNSNHVLMPHWSCYGDGSSTHTAPLQRFFALSFLPIISQLLIVKLDFDIDFVVVFLCVINSTINILLSQTICRVCCETS